MYTTLKHKETGIEHSVHIQKFTGKKYKDITDRVGEPDNRLMVYGSSFQFKVYENADAIEKDFETVNGANTIDSLRQFI